MLFVCGAWLVYSMTSLQIKNESWLQQQWWWSCFFCFQMANAWKLDIWHNHAIVFQILCTCASLFWHFPWQQPCQWCTVTNCNIITVNLVSPHADDHYENHSREGSDYDHVNVCNVGDCWSERFLTNVVNIGKNKNIIVTNMTSTTSMPKSC